MKDLLLGWLFKGRYEVSTLDTIICMIEMFIVVAVISVIWTVIDWIKEKWSDKDE